MALGDGLAKTSEPDYGSTHWVTRAECAKAKHDPEAWFPMGNRKWTPENHAAQTICVAVCPVRSQCFIYACQIRLQQMDLWGIWAGYPPSWFDNRRRVAEALRRAKAAR